MPAEKKQEFAVSLPVTFMTPVTETPVMDVTDSAVDPAVTPNASVTPEPPTVALPEITAEAEESAPEIVAEATVSEELAALIAPDEVLSPAAKVARREL